MEIKNGSLDHLFYPESGKTGFYSQSRTPGSSILLTQLREAGTGIAYFLSAETNSELNENDLLDYWQNDPKVDIIAFYLERFENGLNFILPSLNGETRKPVIVLKAGKSENGMKAASIHTGISESDDKIVDALLRQSGIIRVGNFNELVNTVRGFENFPFPKGNRVAVITNAGGPGILCIDSLEKEGLDLADFSDETKKELRSFVHPEGNIENPVDLLPGGSAEAFKRAAGLAAADNGVDAVVSIFVEPGMVKPFDVAEGIDSIVSEKPILQVIMPFPEFWEYYRTNSARKLPHFKNPEDPAEILSNMLFFESSRMKRNSKQYRLFTGTKQGNKKLEGGLSTNHKIDLLRAKYGLPRAQHFIKAKHKLMIRGFRDPSFGPIITFGSGVDFSEDVSLKSCYLSDDDIADMINSTKIGKILCGVRGEIPFDLTELKRILASCARMMVENEEITEFEINPLTATEENRFIPAEIRIVTE
jgi:acetate---CoA ligase (ADP-forming)